MRHVYAYRATYLIATLIVVVAMLFAWLRSQDVPPAQQEGAGHHRPPAVQVAMHAPGHVRLNEAHAYDRHGRDGETLDTNGDTRVLRRTAVTGRG